MTGETGGWGSRRDAKITVDEPLFSSITKEACKLQLKTEKSLLKQRNWRVHHEFPHLTANLFHLLNKAIFCFSVQANCGPDNTGLCKGVQSGQFLSLLEHFFPRLLLPKDCSDTATKI